MKLEILKQGTTDNYRTLNQEENVSLYEFAGVYHGQDGCAVSKKETHQIAAEVFGHSNLRSYGSFLLRRKKEGLLPGGVSSIQSGEEIYVTTCAISGTGGKGVKWALCRVEEI